MQNLTIWAKNNPRKAQTFIVIGNFLIAFLSIQVGFLLFEMNFLLPIWTKYILIPGLIFAILFYPNRLDFEKTADFLRNRQKVDFLLLTLGAILTVFFTQQIAKEETLNASNQLGLIEMQVSQNPLAKLAVYNTSQEHFEKNKPIYLTEKKSKTPFYQKWMGKKIVKYLWKKEGKPLSDNQKVLLAALLVLCILALEYLIVVYACQILCSGMEAVAAVLFFGGLAGLMAVSAFLFGKIFPKVRRAGRLLFGFILIIPALAALFF